MAEELARFDAGDVIAHGLAVRWARGRAAAPFEHPQDWGGHDSLRWNRDATGLWARTQRGWIQWDAVTGGVRRRAAAPDDLEPPFVAMPPSYDVLAVARGGTRVVMREYGSKLCDGSRTPIAVLDRSYPDARFAFSPDGTRVVGGLGKELVVWRADDGTELSRTPGVALDGAWQIVWASAGVVLVSRRNDLRAYDVDYQRSMWERPLSVRDLQPTRDGTTVGVRTTDYDVVILDLATGADVAVPTVRSPLLLRGEPDPAALMARLIAEPIVLSSVRDRIDAIRPYAGGSRAELDIYRLDTSSGTLQLAIELATGAVVQDEAVPWRKSKAAIARAVAGLTVDAPALRAVSSDGRYMVFVLGRNAYEYSDPDAGTLVSYDVSVGLWDDVEARWRWETSRSPDGVGVGTWLMEQGHFGWTFDETGIWVRGSGATSWQVYDVTDGSLRGYRETDTPAQPRGCDGKLLAGDRDRRLAVVQRDSVVELWDVVAAAKLGALDLAAIDDSARTAAIVSPEGDFVVGTELGRILRAGR
ncbi:MAG TPA: hypothetical protein VFQ53_31435 [Kofleriaceae bacterium]|nr:hypothetical protein [Kofleriaceae bacterium]